jgi:hypothetical protein
MDMDIKAQVGETSGKVWDLLNSGGPQTFDQMKKKLNVTTELLNLATGWLAREDKVNILEGKNGIRVQLK